jgi:hypothetical protein
LRVISALFVAGIYLPLSAFAQDVPPRELFDKIILQLPKPLGPAKIFFKPLPNSTSDDACRMQNFEMTLAREDTSKAIKYSVLLDPQSSGARADPRQLLAVIRRLAVDADGAERAYHPEDPYGNGVCERRKVGDNKVKLEGVCALDSFAPSGIRIFLETQRARLTDPKKPVEGVPSLADLWKQVWPLIRDRKLRSYDPKSVSPKAPDGYRMFYWNERKLTTFIKGAIIPHTKDGYPCVRDSESTYPGYFVAATTLTQQGLTRADGCTPKSFLDASEIPFFVLPGGNFGHIEIGDIVIGHFKSGTVERTAFGIAGDAGPIEQFGEGSIAFNQVLLGKSGQPVVNVQDVNALDIDSAFLARENAALGILVLGGTKKRLNGNYSLENIEKIGREELARWNGGSDKLTQRLNACVMKAKSQ